jgi:hypothetical protein
MSKDSWGASATMATHGRGLLGARGIIELPQDFNASGIDSEHYFDAYIGIFTDSPRTAFLECGLGYYGELHKNKNSKGQVTGIGKAFFPHQWQSLVNPVKGRLLGGKDKPQGQRNAVYVGSNTVRYELVIKSSNLAVFMINGKSFKGSTGFTFGYAGQGVSQQTFSQGFNIKICIGYNDVGGKGVSFKGMKITADELKHRNGSWKPAPFRLVEGLPHASVQAVGSSLTVSYPA